MKLHLDCTHTRLQTVDVGITRVVRGLARGLRETQHGIELGFLAYHRDGFRQATPLEAVPRAQAAGDLYRLSGRIWVRHLIKAAVPVTLQVWAWRRFGRFAYSGLAKDLPPADIRAGDVVIAGDAGWGYDVWACVEQARRRGARIVTIVYDVIPLTDPQYCSAAHRLLFETWLPDALRFSDAIVCISEATRAELVRYCDANHLACPPTASFRLGGELPPAASAQPRESVRALADAAPFFLTVGSIEPRKNHELLLDVFEACWKKGLAAPLVIVGRPVDGMQATLARIRSHPELGRRLHLLSDCGDAELDFLYQRARAVILATLAEGFGLPLVEARQRGCEVLASRIPAFEELADSGVRLFAPGSADELAALVSETAATATRAAPMPAFTWRDSALQFIGAIARTAGSRSQ